MSYFKINWPNSHNLKQPFEPPFGRGCIFSLYYARKQFTKNRPAGSKDCALPIHLLNAIADDGNPANRLT